MTYDRGHGTQEICKMKTKTKYHTIQDAGQPTYDNEGKGYNTNLKNNM